MLGEVQTGATNEADYAAAAAEGERLAARARRNKRILIGFWAVSSTIELYFITQYLTWIEFWRLSGKGMAVGSGFAVALFGVIELFAAVRTWRYKRRVLEAMQQPGIGMVGDFPGIAPPSATNTWGCLDCGMRGIGPAPVEHACPAKTPP